MANTTSCFNSNSREGAPSFSDEVDLGLTLLEVLVHYGGLLVAATTLANEGGQPVSISDAGWLLDGTGNVVVVVAQFESEQLDLVGRGAHCVVQHAEAGGRRHSLACSNRNKVELIYITVGDDRVNDGASLRVLHA